MLATDLTAHIDGTVSARSASASSSELLLQKPGLLTDQIVVDLLSLV